MSFKIPILILSFNRPSLIKKQIDSLKELNPTSLYMYSDGPRNEIISDQKKVNKCRRIFHENITWNCKTKYKFEKTNKGCGPGVSEAITWFFSNVEKGIIIEDDCLLNKSFFPFAEEMLEIYENDFSIAGITADYKLGASFTNNYGFIPFPLIWGWATWKRSWEDYSLNLEKFDKNNMPPIFSKMPRNQKKYWIKNFEKISFEKRPHTWDYQFSYLVMSRNQKFIYPHTNLVSNLGFTKDATHTKNPYDKCSKLKTGEIFKPYQPDIKSDKYSNYLSKRVFINKSKLKKLLSYSKFFILNFIKSIKNYK